MLWCNLLRPRDCRFRPHPTTCAAHCVGHGRLEERISKGEIMMICDEMWCIHTQYDCIGPNEKHLMVRRKPALEELGNPIERTRPPASWQCHLGQLQATQLWWQFLVPSGRVVDIHMHSHILLMQNFAQHNGPNYYWWSYGFPACCRRRPFRWVLLGQLVGMPQLFTGSEDGRWVVGPWVAGGPEQPVNAKALPTLLTLWAKSHRGCESSVSI